MHPNSQTQGAPPAGITIRPEQPADLPGVRDVLREAFRSDDEPALVDRIRAAGPPGMIALAAVDQATGAILGHIIFTPVSIRSGSGDWAATALGPLAVRPASQGRGIGSALTRAGLAACRAAGETVVVLLGHAHYYPRFGFVPASLHGISSRYAPGSPDFQVLELTPGAIAGRSGAVEYLPQFDG